MRIKGGLKAVAAAGVIVMAAAAPALAKSVDVSGGRWSYDVGANYAYSNFYHKVNYHSSSVHGAIWAYSGCTKNGTWSKASVEKSDIRNDAFYDASC
ncbi:lactococcin 972 family bacteriocin [Streptomyces sp. NPDC003758]|uniref:Lactococcin 972 family bacteriocin n=1 Tax=Streptomyces cynarae TaxID=2981134 RepID=A0ABY6E5Z1_9ACTN|nr:lactococcin 972 family bacteriocin [Streptomyces cynarae]UXY22057.1 lactococcin 972 family bacteriocin [Streptomyces cynarae]